MIDCLLLWALPDSWKQYELLSPDVDRRIEKEMRQRFEETDLDDQDLLRLIILQTDSLRDSVGQGVVLFATQDGAHSEDELPPIGLSLTLALANRPMSPKPGRQSSSTESCARAQSSEDTNFGREAKPLVLENPALTALTSERRMEVTLPGVDTPISHFQAQAFVMPNSHAGMAVITVNAFHPASEEHARQTARAFANSIAFVAATEELPTPHHASPEPNTRRNLPAHIAESPPPDGAQPRATNPSTG